MVQPRLGASRSRVVGSSGAVEVVGRPRRFVVLCFALSHAGFAAPRHLSGKGSEGKGREGKGREGNFVLLCLLAHASPRPVTFQGKEGNLRRVCSNCETPLEAPSHTPHCTAPAADGASS